MLSYPSILGSNDAPLGMPCIAFDKLDGSNIRIEYSGKKGWSKFGTKAGLFDYTHPVFGESFSIFPKIEKDIFALLHHFYPKISLDKTTVFCEFFGARSFAGTHFKEDVKNLILFDVFIPNMGFVPPTQFVKIFKEAPFVPKVIYQGNLNKEFIKNVQDNVYQLKEGVVCKGKNFSVKIKTMEWLERLKMEKPEIYQTENEIILPSKGIML